MKRPKLTEVRMSRIKESRLVITMSPGQWDALLDEGYNRGALLLEIDQEGQPVRAYQRPDAPPVHPETSGDKTRRCLYI